jgi:GMP synthase (glutamine-hydrolysing)
MTRPVLILQHVAWERPAILGEILTAHDVSWTTQSILFGSAKKPALDDFSGIVILGGEMGALDFDRWPGLRLEAELVREAVSGGVPLVGICLGHQIVATALGGQLHSGAASEIGMGTVTIEVDDPVFGQSGTKKSVLHWHHDVAEAPDGAVVIASTDQTPNQAFRLGETVFCTQFHVEVDRRMLDRWLAVDQMVDGLDSNARAKIASDFDSAAPSMRKLSDLAFDGFAEAALARG